MWSYPAASLTFWRKSWWTTCTLILLTWGLPVSGDESFLNKPPEEWTENQALQVLNDSSWAHTVTTSTQDAPCTYENPAFPGLYAKPDAVGLDSMNPARPVEAVKPDGAEYVIRFQSVKPVQAAIQRLIALGEEWSGYGKNKYGVESGPTDLENARYNVGDMITIAVILKHPGPGGASFLDYGSPDHKHIFPGRGEHLWPCAGLRTSNGQVFARLVPDDVNSQFPSIQLSFPRLVDGKPLISHADEKVEFRFVVRQRVFETTFSVNSGHVLDGSEGVLYLPGAVTDLTQQAQQ